MINELLGAARPLNDLNNDGAVNVVDLQIVLNASFREWCSASQSISPLRTPTRRGASLMTLNPAPHAPVCDGRLGGVPGHGGVHGIASC